MLMNQTCLKDHLQGENLNRGREIKIERHECGEAKKTRDSVETDVR